MQPYKDYRYKTQDGLNLYARDYPCLANHQTGDFSERNAPNTIICLPGLTRNSADFAELAEHLTDRFRVITLDLRGRGKSDYDPDPNNYHPGTYVEDVIGLIDALKLESVILIGTSLGGLVSMLLAAKQPERIAAAVINDIGPEIDPRGLERIKTYVCNPKIITTWDEAVSATRTSLSREHPVFSENDWIALTHRLFCEDAKGAPIRNYDPEISALMKQSPDAAPPDLWPTFSSIHTLPLLIVRGERSDILSTESVNKMRAINARMKYVEIPNCGHAPLLTEPESLISINHFLDSL